MKHAVIPTLLAAVAGVAAWAPFDSGRTALAQGRQDKEDEKKQSEEQQKKIAKLVEQLGAENFEVREKATAELKKIGAPATDALKKASESEDAEVRTRARAILKSFEKKDDSTTRPKRQQLRPGMPGMRGSSVMVQSNNGNSTYTITPSEGDPITFHKNADGSVKLEYTDDKREKQTASSESLEKFLKDNKDLAAKYGITQDGISLGGARVSFNGRPMPGFQFNWGNGWGDRDEDGQDPFEELNKQMDRLRERFRNFDANPFGLDEDEILPVTGSAQGAYLEGVTDLLRSHLDIPADTGLVVRRVKEDSVAAKLGLKKHDIIIEIDGKKVSQPRDVRKNLTKESKVSVLRGGKKQELKIEKEKDK